MSRVQFSITSVDGKPGPVEISDGDMPDGTFIVGWGVSEEQEKLIVMFSPGDGESTLHAQAATYFPRLPQEKPHGG